MKDRLQKLLAREDLTPVRFAEKVGVQRSSVSHILSGRNNPSLDFIQKILVAFPQISTDWLIRGRGEMYNSAQASVNNERKRIPGDLFSSLNDEDTPVYLSSKVKADPDERKTVGKEVRKEQHDEAIVQRASDRRIEKIVVFYSDKTFTEYLPED